MMLVHPWGTWCSPLHHCMFNLGWLQPGRHQPRARAHALPQPSVLLPAALPRDEAIAESAAPAAPPSRAEVMLLWWLDLPSQTKTITAPVTLVQTTVTSRRDMDPRELHTPHHIARCHRSALPLLPLKMGQGLGTGLPVSPEGRSPIAAGVMCPPRHSGCPCGWWHHRTHWHPARGRGQLPPQGPAAGTCFCANSGAGVLIRCQRCLSLGLSLLSQALRANIPGIFVMFGSIQHPSEKKKIK